jgi:hypothetical protein
LDRVKARENWQIGPAALLKECPCALAFFGGRYCIDEFYGSSAQQRGFHIGEFPLRFF